MSELTDGDEGAVARRRRGAARGDTKSRVRGFRPEVIPDRSSGLRDLPVVGREPLRGPGVQSLSEQESSAYSVNVESTVAPLREKYPQPRDPEERGESGRDEVEVSGPVEDEPVLRADPGVDLGPGEPQSGTESLTDVLPAERDREGVPAVQEVLGNGDAGETVTERVAHGSPESSRDGGGGEGDATPRQALDTSELDTRIELPEETPVLVPPAQKTIWVPAVVQEALRQQKDATGMTFTESLLDAFDRWYERLEELFPPIPKRNSPLPQRRPGRRSRIVGGQALVHMRMTDEEWTVLKEVCDRYLVSSLSEFMTTIYESEHGIEPTYRRPRRG